MPLLTGNTTVEDLLTEAREIESKLIPGEVFIVRDLFRPIEWRRLSRQTRRDLGRRFWDYITSNNGKSTPLDKTTFNQQKYKRN